MFFSVETKSSKRKTTCANSVTLVSCYADFENVLLIFSDSNKTKAWRYELQKLQASEDIEISPTEVQEMLTEFKKVHPYTYYNEMIPKDHELRVIKTPEPTENLRGDEWDEMYKTWKRQIHDYMQSGPGKDYAQEK